MDDGDSRMGAKYQWQPDPALAAVIGVITVIIVLIPAVCSVCFHLQRRGRATALLGKVGVRADAE